MTKQTSWLLSLGAIKIPKESMYQEILVDKCEAGYKPTSRYSEEERAAIKTGIRKLEKALYVLFKKAGSLSTHEAYNLLLERGFMPITVYRSVMREGRFRQYYHKIRLAYGFDTFKRHNVNYIKSNCHMGSAELSKQLGLKEEYVKKVMKRK